jgi:hypothetical protein
LVFLNHNMISHLFVLIQLLERKSAIGELINESKRIRSPNLQ